MLIYLETSWNILIYSEILSGYPDLSWDILRHPEDILRYLRIFWSNPRYPNLAWDILLYPEIYPETWDIPRISWDFRSIMFWSICDILRYPDSSWDIRRISWNILRHSRVLLIFRHPGDNMLIYLETSWNILIYSEILSGYPDLSWDILRHPEDILRYLRIFWSNPRYPNLAWDMLLYPEIYRGYPEISAASCFDLSATSWDILVHPEISGGCHEISSDIPGFSWSFDILGIIFWSIHGNTGADFQLPWSEATVIGRCGGFNWDLD